MAGRAVASARCVVVLVTCPTGAVARRLARQIVRRRLAACVNVLPPVQSVYRWKGNIEQSREALLVIKSTAARFQALRRGVLALHPYDVPEIIALPIVAGHPPYLAWVRQSVIRLRRRPSASPLGFAERRARGEPRPWPGRNALLRRDVAPRHGGGCLAEARRAKAGNRVPRVCPGGSIGRLSLMRAGGARA